MRQRIRDTAVRHASVVAVLVLVVSVVSFVAYVVADRTAGSDSSLPHYELMYGASQVLPYGLVGAVLVARRPDLPFGWLLSLGAVALAIQLPVVGLSSRALDHGYGGELAVWGLYAGVLGFLPIALQGLVNVRFPSGRPHGRAGRVMDRALVIAICATMIGGLLGDQTLDESELPALRGHERFIDGTPVAAIGNVLAVGAPLVILLGLIAGIGVIVRAFRAEGVERKQLQWRAAGVAAALMLFPFAVTETLPDGIDQIDPFVFVATLAVPVLRYDLWAIDALIRRSAAYTLTSSGSALENLVRTTGEMLRLSHVAVLRDDVVLASYGQGGGEGVLTWALEDENGTVGRLVAAPRHGLRELDEQDRQVLATVATLVTESVRADALTAELLQARHELVTAREEERRRLRRDLHDGLGPLLTGLGLNLDAARDSVGADDDRTSTYLRQAKDASSQVIEDIRSLVHGLRPPAIDELGLVGAVQLHAGRIAGDAGVQLSVVTEGDLAVAAAVEVAIFRSVVEGVTNVVRHAGARCAEVSIERTERLVRVVVTDDGSSTGTWQPGVGLVGMRERAEELGGTLTAGPVDGGGRVVVEYPLEVRPE